MTFIRETPKNLYAVAKMTQRLNGTEIVEVLVSNLTFENAANFAGQKPDDFIILAVDYDGE